MKLAAKDLTALLTKPRQYHAALLYGPDEGQAHAHAKAIVAQVLGANYDPLNLTELSGAQLKDDPAALSDALNSLTLMGGERLVWLREPLHTQYDLILENLASPPPAYLLITAGELSSSAKLRKHFEKEKTLASFACYLDDARTLGTLIRDYFKESNLRVEPEAMQYLTSRLGNDRGITLQELEKISLYLDPGATLTLEDVVTLTGDNTDLTLDALCHAVAGGQPADLARLLRRTFEENTQPIGVLRILHNHFQRLEHYQAQIGPRGDIDSFVEKHIVFFKQRPLIKSQLRRWNRATLVRAQHALLECESLLKTGSVPDELTCESLLARLSRSAARAA
jgi:DNA polymerase III subunit delta